MRRDTGLLGIAGVTLGTSVLLGLAASNYLNGTEAKDVPLKLMEISDNSSLIEWCAMKNLDGDGLPDRVRISSTSATPILMELDTELSDYVSGELDFIHRLTIKYGNGGIVQHDWESSDRIRALNYDARARVFHVHSITSEGEEVVDNFLARSGLY